MEREKRKKVDFATSFGGWDGRLLTMTHFPPLPTLASMIQGRTSAHQHILSTCDGYRRVVVATRNDMYVSRNIYIRCISRLMVLVFSPTLPPSVHFDMFSWLRWTSTAAPTTPRPPSSHEDLNGAAYGGRGSGSGAGGSGSGSGSGTGGAVAGGAVVGRTGTTSQGNSNQSLNATTNGTAAAALAAASKDNYFGLENVSGGGIALGSL